MSNWIFPIMAVVLLALFTIHVMSGLGFSQPVVPETDDGSKQKERNLDEDYTADAEALFKRFAERHGLHYEIEDAPMEVCWTFPQQPKLSMPVILGLQNGDELNFGVSDFWSYFFPFESVVERFEHAIDAWVTGDARIAVTGFRGRLLQVREGNRWRSVYGANGCLFPFRWTPFRYEMNEPGRLPPGSA